MRHFLLATLALPLLATACVPPNTAPQQIQASNPTVSYKYHNDQELLTVNQTAVQFCSQYRAVPHAARFTNEGDGNVVVFECLPPSVAVLPAATYNPNLSYTYQTDPELLTAQQNAQAYCRNNGSRQVGSNIVNNGTGSRTVTFQCTGR